MSKEFDEKLCILDAICRCLQTAGYADATLDNDNDSGEVIFTAKSGIEYAIADRDIRRLIEDTHG